MRVQQYVLVVLFALFSFVSGAYAEGEGNKVTESDVRSLLAQMEQAAISKNVAMLTKNFSKDAVITLDLPSSMGGTQRVGLAEYRSMLKQAWAIPAKYTYQMKNVQVNVAADGLSATATDVVVETIEMQGQVVSTETRERVEIISDNGKPIITSVYGKVNM